MCPLSTIAMSAAGRNPAEIDRENAALLEKLTAVASRPSAHAPKKAPAPKISSFELNRRRKEAELNKENLRLLKKLQSTKTALPKEATAAFAPPKTASAFAAGAGADAPAGAGAGAGRIVAGGAGGMTGSLAPRVSAVVKGAPPSRSAAPDMRDLLLQACREDHLYK